MNKINSMTLYSKYFISQHSIKENVQRDILTLAMLQLEVGHLEVLQWLRAQTSACPWDEKTCSFAARGGHPEVLQSDTLRQWLKSQKA
jgi:hypothetical protein